MRANVYWVLGMCAVAVAALLSLVAVLRAGTHSHPWLMQLAPTDTEDSPWVVGLPSPEWIQTAAGVQRCSPGNRFCAAPANVLFLVLTVKSQSKSALAVYHSWARRVHVHWYVDEYIEGIPVAQQTRYQLCRDCNASSVRFSYQKTMFALRDAWVHDRGRHDWYMKVWEDNYVVTENIADLLREQNADEQVMLGQSQYLNHHHFLGGGAGCLISRAALKTLQPQLSTCHTVAERHNDIMNSLTIRMSRWTADDIYLGLCARHAGVVLRQAPGFYQYPIGNFRIGVTLTNVVCRSTVPYRIDPGARRERDADALRYDGRRVAPVTFHSMTATAITETELRLYRDKAPGNCPPQRER